MKYGDSHQRRPCLGQDDVKQYLQRRGAVDLGRVVHIQRDGHKELAQQKHIVGVGKELGHDQGQKGINPAQPLKPDVQRDEGYLAWQHDGREQHQKEHIDPGRTKARKAIGYHRAGNQHAQHAQEGDEQRVEQIPAKGDRGQGFRIVLPMQFDMAHGLLLGDHQLVDLVGIGRVHEQSFPLRPVLDQGHLAHLTIEGHLVQGLLLAVDLDHGLFPGDEGGRCGA